MEEDIKKAGNQEVESSISLYKHSLGHFMVFYINVTFVMLPAILNIAFPKASCADDFSIIPSVIVREEYNDNIFGNVENTADDFITTISPGLELIERTERLVLNLSAKVSPFFFSTYTILNDVDQKYWGSGNYQINQRLRAEANARYDVSNRPDRDIETTGLAESNDKRYQQEYGVGFGYTLTEKTDMAISFGHFKERWDSINLNRQDLETYGAAINYNHNLSYWVDPTIGRLRIGVERYKFETSDTYNYFTTIGAQYWTNETTNLLVELGARYTDANFYIPQLVFVSPSYIQVQIEKGNNKSFGAIGSAAFEMRNERTVSSIKVSHDIRPASGRGTTVQRSGVVIKLRRRFEENLAIAISTGYFRNKDSGNEFSFREINEDTIFVNPSVRWEFYKDLTLEGGYNFNCNKERVEDEEKTRNLFYLQIAYRLPLLE